MRYVDFSAVEHLSFSDRIGCFIFTRVGLAAALMGAGPGGCAVVMEASITAETARRGFSGNFDLLARVNSGARHLLYALQQQRN